MDDLEGLEMAPFGWAGRRSLTRPSPTAGVLVLGTGVLGGVANLLFLTAAGHGDLAVVAALTPMYPAVTVVLARLVLRERWTGPQAAGLLVAALAIGLVTAG